MFACAMTSHSDKISDRLPTTFFVTQYMIKVIGNQIALKHYYVAFNVNTMN